MVDVFSSSKRSEVMSRIRGRGNSSTELALIEAFRAAGIKGWRRHLAVKVNLPAKRSSKSRQELSKTTVVRPDFVFRRQRVAVFVDGCFWHQCPLHSKIPEDNREFWEQKLTRNVQRDRQTDRQLRSEDWSVVRVWEHALRKGQRSELKRRIARLGRLLVGAGGSLNQHAVSR